MKFLWRKITLYSCKYLIYLLFQNSSDCFLSNFSFSKAFSQSSREATIEFELNYEGLTLTNFMRDFVSKHDVPYTVTNNLPNLQISKLNHVKFLSTALQLIMTLNCFCQIVHRRKRVNPSSPYPTKLWRIVLSVFDHFVGLTLKGLIIFSSWSHCHGSQNQNLQHVWKKTPCLKQGSCRTLGKAVVLTKKISFMAKKTKPCSKQESCRTLRRTFDINKVSEIMVLNIYWNR